MGGKGGVVAARVGAGNAGGAATSLGAVAVSVAGAGASSDVPVNVSLDVSAGVSSAASAGKKGGNNGCGSGCGVLVLSCSSRKTWGGAASASFVSRRGTVMSAGSATGWETSAGVKVNAGISMASASSVSLDGSEAGCETFAGVNVNAGISLVSVASVSFTAPVCARFAVSAWDRFWAVEASGASVFVAWGADALSVRLASLAVDERIVGSVAAAGAGAGASGVAGCTGAARGAAEANWLGLASGAAKPVLFARAAAFSALSACCRAAFLAATMAAMRASILSVPVAVDAVCGLLSAAAGSSGLEGHASSACAGAAVWGCCSPEDGAGG